ncbi:hypothetical protein B0H14DRAFT_3781376 [Mycena olivaceomarginata]|nr:hypothetical protein B0H14DRAFT_3781376 [Mycena olivaceomarginata]
MLNSDPSELARLSALDFAAVVPSILLSIDWHQRNTAAPPSLKDPLVSAVHAILAAPATENAELKFPLVRRVISSLPKECIEPYCDALVHLTKDPTEALPGTIGTISAHSTEIIEFLIATQAWVPCHKGDDMAYRSLNLLVHTADEMHPFVPGLLGWLQDQNWPPFWDCWFQLEHFPELVVDPICEELCQGDDGSGRLPSAAVLLSCPTELAQLYDAEGWLPGLAELKHIIALNSGQETPHIRDYNILFSQNGLPEAFAAASNSVYSDV